jgi:hypothetical protein
VDGGVSECWRCQALHAKRLEGCVWGDCRTSRKDSRRLLLIKLGNVGSNTDTILDAFEIEMIPCVLVDDKNI